ncbi:hypothetical protein [Mesorhizobium neociceri]|uniref:Uncharacterized protein n=1 Tax=Mesorhizobium neociceri TaxID=1307853 RepID=A0A838BE70_9HYPH|nr:hypothetical protein [Mesorhizobium neociceri]MBA1144592.1 hypothetical protein [Mesorhizobium neociceri]
MTEYPVGWSPSPVSIDPTEIVGRRLLAKTYKGWPSQNPTRENLKLSPEAFQDTRLGEDLSVDRLGLQNPVKTVVRRLSALASEEAYRASKEFHGWIAMAVQDLKGVKVFPTPLTIEKDGVDNPFHADIDRSLAREQGQAFHLSVSLRVQFQDKGRYVAPQVA